MDEDIKRCGNELHNIEYWLHHLGDPRKDAGAIREIANMLQSVNQVLVASSIRNQQLVREVTSEAGKSLVGAANRFATAGVSLAA